LYASIQRQICLEFELINTLAKTPIKYELLGVEDLPKYELKFDVIFCLGVIYHRSDPVKMLKDLKAGLNKNGTVFIAVSYTHLRAHETPEHLVCRLLLEKKK
ncbi:hypothetical protein K777_10140, partial [Campylobacter coli CVM 41970]|uniref:DUF1698 domain-containing protein n=1 Tax=Campylobacter coli TaxID=195 RepID=UPI000708165B